MRRDPLTGPAAIVPCDGCIACCRNTTVVLWPQHGDDIGSYQTRMLGTTTSGEDVFALDYKPDTTDCIYLGELGCSIHDRVPAVCRAFDCRRLSALSLEMLGGRFS